LIVRVCEMATNVNRRKMKDNKNLREFICC
jgi:hypothetical protein